MITYKHKDTTIEFNENSGSFSATIGGNRVVKSSLAAIKSAINKQAASSFKEFEALNCSYGRPTLDVVRVIGVIKKRYDRRWLLKGNQDTTHVIEHTPSNIATIRRILKKAEEMYNSADRFESEIQKLEDTLVKLTPVI